MSFPIIARLNLSVASKISLGFSIVLVLHISIAVMGHYGLVKAKEDLSTSDSLRHQVEQFSEIDRCVSGLQRNVLLFAFTGYHGPEQRVHELHAELNAHLNELSHYHLEKHEKESIHEMKRHLETHKEIFDSVVTDRAKRRELANEVLPRIANQFDANIQQLAQNGVDLFLVEHAKTAFKTAELSTLQFINSPDSTHVSRAKTQLANVSAILNGARQTAKQDGSHIERTVSSVDEYGDTLIQMVQATRGYLHLVNVVLTGESEEFKRLASESRIDQSRHVNELSQSMSADREGFEFASNAFSIITILLGAAAAWLIARDVASPLNAITQTLYDLTHDRPCETIPAIGRNDELGRLAEAARIFRDKASETQRLLSIAESNHEELTDLNLQLAEQTAIANSMVGEATAATMAKSEFLANMSHEIRTPMTAILGFADTLADSIDDEDNLAAIDTIRRNGDHLIAIINDILDISKVEAGKMRIEKISVDPCKLVADVLSLVKVKAEGAGLTLEANFKSSLPTTIQTDPTRLRQILINLVGNAIKFTELGSVRLETSMVENSQEPLLQFDVIDTGVGMTNNQVDALFQPFSQADMSTTRRFGGTGLGLTISKRFAEMLGGDLTLVETEENAGSRFRVTVSTGSLDGVEINESPTVEIHAKANQTEHSTSQSLEGLRVLLAEDGPDNQRLISFVLKKAGADVDVVENGELAMESALAARDSNSPYNCILMDMQMPVMGGYEATRLLRCEGYSGAIIALTAHAMGGDEKKCLHTGCDYYLTKPIDRTLLVSKVHEWSQKSSSASPLVPDVGQPNAFTAAAPDIPYRT